MKRPTDECLFCAKYLLGYGYNGKDIDDMKPMLENFTEQYSLTKIQNNYWHSIAEKLRNLWPPGEKDGKYPWRDSVENLSKRLQLLWATRLSNKYYSEEQVLQVARQYLSQFEHDMKYMKLLKYFILKQDRMVQTDGKIQINNVSILADMLESAEEQGWFTLEEIIEPVNSMDEGVLI